MSAVEKFTPQEQVPAVPASEGGAIIAMIERAARDPSVDIDKFERLMAMKERAEAEVARRAYNDALAKAQSEILPVARRAKNTHTGSQYARLEDIHAALTPIITAHGFSMSFGTEDSPHKDHYRVTCTVAHTGGHQRNYFADVPSDLVGAKGNSNKTAVQGFGSTMSYGRRYLTMLIFNVALVNEDNDGNRRNLQTAEDAPVLSEDQLKQIRAALAFRGSSEEKFCKYILKVGALEDVYAHQFDAAMAKLKTSGDAK